MSWFFRQQPPTSINQALFAGFATTIALALLHYIGELSALPLIMAPFGASCVLLFTAADSPLSQPVNVIGGHLLATLTGLLFQFSLGSGPISIALATGTAIALMRWLRITHPPAGANPMVVFAEQETFSFLLFPVLPGCLFLVLFTALFHRFLNSFLNHSSLNHSHAAAYPNPAEPFKRQAQTDSSTS